MDSLGLITQRAKVSYQSKPLPEAVCYTLSDLEFGKATPAFFEAHNMTQQDCEHDLLMLLTAWHNTQK